MKKLLFLIFMFTIFMNVQGVKAAVGDDITFVCDNTYSSGAVVGTVVFGAEATEVAITLPENRTTIWDNGSHIFKVLFYDINDNVVDGFEIPEVFGSHFRDNYTYNIQFDRLDIDTDAYYLEVIIPMAVNEACDSAAVDYYTANSDLVVGYLDRQYGILQWKYIENAAAIGGVFPYPYLETGITPIELGAKYLTLNNGATTGLGINFQKSSYLSTITFYDSSFAEIDTYNLNDFRGEREYILYELDIDISLLDFYEQMEYFSVKEVQTDITPDTIYFNNLNFVYSFDNVSIPIINYYIDGEIDYTVLAPVGSVVYYEGESTDKVGYDFIGWTYHDNIEYAFPDVLNDDYLINGVINLYAQYSEIPDEIIGVVDDFEADEENTFTVAMTSLGFNDPVERTIVFGFVIIITSLLLLFKGVSSFAILIVVAAELIFFMYLGIIPLFAGIMVGIVLLLIGFKSLGGASNE